MKTLQKSQLLFMICIKIVANFYGDKIRNMTTLKRDPKKKILTRKIEEKDASLGKARRSVKNVYKKHEPS